jgi:hypothetical protein
MCLIPKKLKAALIAVTTLFCFLLIAHGAQAAPAIELGATGTDGKVYNAKFTVSLTLANGTENLASVKVEQAVKLTGTISADLTHRNKLADVFVVERYDNQFYMRNKQGMFVPWDGDIAKLQAAKENVNLGTSLSVDIYNGTYNSAAKHQVFLGYLVSGGTAMVYTPIPAEYEIKAEEISISPVTFFGDKIETPLLQTKCIACHVSGGIAKDSAFLLDRASSTSLDNNYAVLKSLLTRKGADYILSKASGNVSHTGGVQINVGSEEYANLATVLNLLSGKTTTVTVPANDFFNGVTLQTRAETLRRAAIMLAGRAPTQEEIELVNKGDENTLRTALRNLMTGPGFHSFLTEGTNDRLLVEGVQGQVIDPNASQWPKFMQAIYDIKKAGKDAGLTASEYRGKADTANDLVNNGLKRSVGELVSYVVEKDKPYTEVLTADYLMMTPSMSFVMDGGATFNNANNPWEFQPGRITNYYLPDGNQKTASDIDLGTYLLSSSKKQYMWQHVGILNHLAFMQRYPTTATNRNRARARWTMLHFLDIDIEKSTQRPTDAAALADTNNPTLKNPACTACHERMDPVAASFQNYGDNSFYFHNGVDSLDHFYKFPPKGAAKLYVQGDKWYRDMRSPGLLGQAITDTNEPLKQLAQLIIKDPGFARATVKFWWPSVFGSEILLAPVVTTDADYQARLTAYQAQAAAIEQFARNFRKDYNLKSLLADMTISPWFRAKSTTRADKLAAYVVADVGIEKLLTPERLQRKTEALTGYNWGYSYTQDRVRVNSNLGVTYRGLYGGIDSFAVVERSRDITPLMSVVAQSHALESACPIVLREFILPDVKRLLFDGLDQSVTPLTKESTYLELTSKDQNDWQTISLFVDLAVGTNNILVGMTNPYCQWDGAKCITQRVFYLDRFEIKAPGQNVFQQFEITADISKNYKPQCYRTGTNNALSYGGCLPNMFYDAKVAGRYEVRAVVAAQQAGEGSVQALLTVQHVVDPQQATTTGARLIKQKLADLHNKLLGSNYTIDSAEISDAYAFFTKIWQEKSLSTDGNPSLTNSNLQLCTHLTDFSFMEGLGYAGQALIPRTTGTGYDWDYANINNFIGPRASDPTYSKQTWVVVMAYLLSHYDYLYE